MVEEAHFVPFKSALVVWVLLATTPRTLLWLVGDGIVSLLIGYPDTLVHVL
jgi:hypothetical protein